MEEMVLQTFTKIKGASDIYRVSNKGSFKTFHPRYKTPRRLKPGIGNGYYTVCLLMPDGSRLTHYVHRILAIAFIPNPENKKCVNHIDGNKLNNELSNLEWVTHGENNSHAIKIGLKKSIHPARGVIQMDLNGNEIARYRTSEDVPGFNSGTICKAANSGGIGKGFKWKYIN